MHQVLLVVQILVAIALIGLILLQQGRGADAGAAFGSGSSGSIFGSRGPATFLAKITALLAAVFFANSIGLAYITTQTVERRSVVERFEDDRPPVGAPGIATDAAGDIPLSPSDGATEENSDIPATPEPQGETQSN